MPKKKTHQTRNMTILISVAMIILAILIIPINKQQRLNVTIGQDKIIEASAQTVNVPLVSTFFTRPANEGTGIYTIEAYFGPNTYYINNVPIGTYTFVLNGNYEGTYEITLRLWRGGNFQNLVDTATINATF